MFETSAGIIAGLLIVRFVAMEAIYIRAKGARLERRFPITIVLRFPLDVGVPLCVFVGAYKILEEPVGFWMIFAVAILLVGFINALGALGEIAIDLEGIKQKLYWGLRTKVIPWERAAARYVPGLREVLVIGRNGVAITHSRYHVGQYQFIQALKSHGVFLQGDIINSREIEGDLDIPII